VDETGQHDLSQLRSLQDWNIKLALESVPGVSQVASVGGYVRQYQITVEPNRLASYGISLMKVMDAVRKSNIDVEGRVLELAGTEYMVRGRGTSQASRTCRRSAWAWARAERLFSCATSPMWRWVPRSGADSRTWMAGARWPRESWWSASARTCWM